MSYFSKNAALLFACMTTLSFAQTAPSGTVLPVKQGITKEQAAKHPGLAQHFEDIDTNHDGVISRDEMKAAHDKHSMKMGREGKPNLDTDGDGRISRAEAAGHKLLAQHFDDIDTNHDGFLAKDEMKAAHEKHVALKAEGKPPVAVK